MLNSSWISTTTDISMRSASPGPYKIKEYQGIIHTHTVATVSHAATACRTEIGYRNLKLRGSKVKECCAHSN